MAVSPSGPGPTMSKHKVKNWYADRYFSTVIQRNFLFLFATVSSVGILVSLALVKNLYEQKSVDPYLIEVEKQSNTMAIVDSTSKEQYTAQEAIKEYFVDQYINAREGYSAAKSEDNLNLVRVFSSPDIYGIYTKQATNNSGEISTFSRDVVVNVKIISRAYLTPNRLEMRFAREFYSQELSKKVTKYYRLLLGFNFVSLELTQADLRLNPLGFQVTSYAATEEKVYSSEDQKDSS